ncbi:glucosaminidase domain-containing protein [Salinicola halophilus]|uniref:glucosaminidase domain-containing protein n=1 Tax=Salinicola halophilus TaxID=184065 RepID=UPI000DA1B940|nr:glucosaminidase domain-containing protein [Salinicola halophilus]
MFFLNRRIFERLSSRWTSLAPTVATRRRTLALTLGLALTWGGASLSPVVQAAPTSQLAPTLHGEVQPPALDPVDELPDLRKVKAGPKRKAAFLELVVPLVQAENARVQADRNWLVGIETRVNPLREDERRRLAALCDDYGVAYDGGEVPRELLARVNTVPLEMVVIQAVEESGWGTSRIARQSNNVFGMRCFSDGCGIAQQGTSRRFQVFDTVRDGVHAYLHNLNTHRAYAQLRRERNTLALQGKSISAERLIGTLHNYSTSPDYQSQLLGLLQTNGDLIRRHGIEGGEGLVVASRHRRV